MSEEYFGPHLGASLSTGFSVQSLTQTGWEVNGIYSPIIDINNSWVIGDGITEFAWWSMRGGSETIYLTAFIMQGIDFIKEPKYQNYFFQRMIWLIFISWVNTAWIKIAFLFGGLTEGGNWSDLIFLLANSIFHTPATVLLTSIIYVYLLKLKRRAGASPAFHLREMLF